MQQQSIVTPGMIVLLVLLIIVAVACAVLFVTMMTAQKKAAKGRLTVRQIRKATERFTFYHNNFITRTNFRKVTEQLSALSIYSPDELKVQAVKFYQRSIFLALGIALFGIIFVHQLIPCLLLFVFGVVARDATITSSVESLRQKVVVQLSQMLSSLREHYAMTASIPDALAECQKGNLISAPIEKIHVILTSPNGEDLLEEFRQTIPFHIIQTFANVCYIAAESGDEKDEHGISIFKTAIGLLKTETDVEIRKIERKKLSFGTIKWLPFAALIMAPLLESFFKSNMPGTSVIYNGMFGMVGKVIIILSCLLGYFIVQVVQYDTVVSHNDRNGFVDSLLDKKWFARLVKNVTPKRSHSLLKVTANLKGAISHQNIRHIYGCKLLYCGLTFVTVYAVLVVFVFTSRDFTYNNMQSYSLSGGTEVTADESVKLRELDDRTLNAGKNFPPRDRDLELKLKETFPGWSDMQVDDQVNRIKSKFRTYWGTKYSFALVIIAQICTIIVWFVPEFLLKQRKKLVVNEAEEDVFQLQTIIAVLMYTKCDTLTAIEWLVAQSRLHKNVLNYAYNEYPSAPEMALERLRDNSSIPDFRQLVERLTSTIYNVSILDAFGDIASEKDQALRLREMRQEVAIQKSRHFASMFVKAPMVFVALFSFIGPLIILGVSEFMAILPELIGG
jgi:hypothetical protein